MLLCPDCFTQFDEDSNHCLSCNWKKESINGIPVYLSSADKSDHIFSDYLKNYHQISIDDLEHSIQNETYLNIQTEKFFSYVGNVEGLNVCELGVGQGKLLKKLLEAKPKKLTGVDISVPYLELYKNQDNISVIIANAENIPFKNEFDIIIASDILEHVLNVGDFLLSANRALKQGGKFVIKTPNNEDLTMYSRLAGCKYKFVHLRNFNKYSLSKLMVNSGFKIEKIYFDGFYPSRKRSYIVNNKFLNQRFDNFCKRYTDVHEISGLNNMLGCILMEPLEMTVICVKKTDILD
jgi:2-polyprenyl-3-methyl-5-hydroxy-6-metoxy-1,4-benzoquinol methylase